MFQRWVVSGCERSVSWCREMSDPRAVVMVGITVDVLGNWLWGFSSPYIQAHPQKRLKNRLPLHGVRRPGLAIRYYYCA